MQSLDVVGLSLKAHIPEILQDLQAVCDREPWCRLSPEDRLNNLPQVTRGLVDVALASDANSKIRLDEVHAAAEHGEHRLKAGFPEELLFTELSLLRFTLWNFVWAHVSRDLARQASVRLDAATRLVMLAASRGYHRPEFEARGEWPRAVDQLANRWPV